MSARQTGPPECRLAGGVSQTGRLWVVDRDELPGEVELPRTIVALESISPCGQQAQRPLRHGRRTKIGDRREPTAEHGVEVANAPSQPRAQPGRVCVA